MRTKYAKAIRYGLEKARETEYGSETDQFYAIRSHLFNRIVFSGEVSRFEATLSLKAFDRERENDIKRRTALMTKEQKIKAEKAFHKAWILRTETTTERELRLLREEVERLRAELKQARVNVLEL